MTHERARHGAVGHSRRHNRTTYVLRRPGIDGTDTYSWCTLSNWPEREREGWRYVEMVTEDSRDWTLFRAH